MRIITWKEIDIWTAILVAKIGKEKFGSIFAFPRGGLILGVMLSHRLKIPLLTTISSDTLLVDDIADTGGTLKKFSQKKAVLIWRNTSAVKPEFFGVEIDSEAPWQKFPWETV